MRQSMKQMIVLQSVQQMIPYDVRETIQRESIERLSIEGVEEGSGRLFDHAPYPRRLIVGRALLEGIACLRPRALSEKARSWTGVT